MTAAHDHEDLQRLIDRLPPAQVRRLRSLVAADPDFRTYVEPAAQREERYRLPPAQVRRLRSLVAADPDFRTYVEPAAQREERSRRPGLAAFVGSFDSGRGDLAERHEELIQDGMERSR